MSFPALSSAARRCGKRCRRITIPSGIPPLRHPHDAPDGQDPKRKEKGWRLAPYNNSGWTFGAKSHRRRIWFRLIVGGHLGAFWLWASGSPRETIILIALISQILVVIFVAATDWPLSDTTSFLHCRVQGKRSADQITAGADNCAIRAVGNPKIYSRPSSLVSAEPIESKSLTGESRTQARCRCRRQVLLRPRLATSRMRASPPVRIRHLAYDSIPRQFIFSSKTYVKQSTDHLFYGACFNGRSGLA